MGSRESCKAAVEVVPSLQSADVLAYAQGHCDGQVAEDARADQRLQHMRVTVTCS